MKKIFIAVLLFAVVFGACGYDIHDEAKTVLWDAPSTGADGYVVVLVDHTDEGNYMFAGETSATQLYIDLVVLGIYGYYEVRIRAFKDNNTPNGVERVYSDYASSSIPADCAGGITFFLYRELSGTVPEKPTAIGVQ